MGDAGARANGAEPALVAPAGATKWKVDGLELVAPPERELLYAIVRDFDGDGKKDALALVRPPAPPGKPNEVGAAQIVYYAGASSPARASEIAVAPDPRIEPVCTPIARLERIGPRSALVEVGTSCTRGPSSRALFVVRLVKDPTVAFGISVLDPPGAPKLAIDVDGEDRDHDGIDDVTLHVTIEGGAPPFEPGPKLSAKVAFLDCSAGPSRDPDEPEASMKAIAAQVTARAGKPREAATVPVLVQQMRMLYRAMCIEGGAPRLVKLRATSSDPSAGAVACGASKPLEDAGVAEVRAFVTQGDALRALASASAAQLAPATKTAARTTEIGKLLGEVAPFVQARSTRLIGITLPTSRAAHPEWGSLAFEPSGKLLVRGPSAVSRVDPDTGESADAELPAWPTQVLSPDGKSRWLEAYSACEGVGLRATFAPTDGESEMRDVLLPVAPPLGSRCAGGRGEAAHHDSDRVGPSRARGARRRAAATHEARGVVGERHGVASRGDAAVRLPALGGRSCDGDRHLARRAREDDQVRALSRARARALRGPHAVHDQRRRLAHRLREARSRRGRHVRPALRHERAARAEQALLVTRRRRAEDVFRIACTLQALHAGVVAADDEHAVRDERWERHACAGRHRALGRLLVAAARHEQVDLTAVRDDVDAVQARLVGAAVHREDDGLQLGRRDRSRTRGRRRRRRDAARASRPCTRSPSVAPRWTSPSRPSSAGAESGARASGWQRGLAPASSGVADAVGAAPASGAALFTAAAGGGGTAAVPAPAPLLLVVASRRREQDHRHDAAEPTHAGRLACSARIIEVLTSSGSPSRRPSPVRPGRRLLPRAT